MMRCYRKVLFWAAFTVSPLLFRMLKAPESAQIDVKGEVNVASVDAAAADDDWVPDVDLSHLDEEQKRAVMAVLMEERDVFSRNDSDIGDIKDFTMKIDLEDDIPVREAYRRIPRNLYSEVQDYINDLLTNGWIRESNSSYCSPIVCVRKKDGGLRMCVDYRKLNGKTRVDSQPIPRIQDILDRLAGKKWFSTFHLSHFTAEVHPSHAPCLKKGGPTPTASTNTLPHEKVHSG